MDPLCIDCDGYATGYCDVCSTISPHTILDCTPTKGFEEDADDEEVDPI